MKREHLVLATGVAYLFWRSQRQPKVAPVQTPTESPALRGVELLRGVNDLIFSAPNPTAIEVALGPILHELLEVRGDGKFFQPCLLKGPDGRSPYGGGSCTADNWDESFILRTLVPGHTYRLLVRRTGASPTVTLPFVEG